jgi:hypothetical protein
MIVKGHGAVWDVEKNKILCRFINGLFETDDKVILRKLSEMGFDIPVEAFTDQEDLKEVEKEIKPAEEKPKANPKAPAKPRATRQGVKK